jgi:hypothetical protein
MNEVQCEALLNRKPDSGYSAYLSNGLQKLITLDYVTANMLFLKSCIESHLHFL